MTKRQRRALVEMLWGQLPKDPDHDDRRILGGTWGTKTKTGLCACIERIMDDNFTPPPTPVVVVADHIDTVNM